MFLCTFNATTTVAASCPQGADAVELCNQGGRFISCHTENTWKLSVLTIILLSWGFLGVLPGILWLIYTAVMRSPNERAAQVRDTATMIIAAPALLFQTVGVITWNYVSEKISPGQPESSKLDWRAFWARRAPGWGVAVQLSASTTLFYTVVALIAASPAIPLVEACTLQNGVEVCNLPDWLPQTAPNTAGYFYTNATILFTRGVNTGYKYTNVNFTSVISCNGDRPLGMPNTYAKHKAWVVSGGTTVSIGPTSCFGAGVGVAIGPPTSWLSAVVTAVWVRCPGQVVPVSANTMTPESYINWATAEIAAYSDVRMSTLNQLCKLNAGCVPFPQLGEGLGDLYINGGTVTTNAAGAQVRVTPSQTESRSAVVVCAQGKCWSETSLVSDELSGRLPAALTPQEIIEPSVPYTGGDMIINPEFDSSHSRLFVDSVAQCAHNSGPISYISATTKAGWNTAAYSSWILNKVIPAGCLDHWSSSMTGETSPIPTDEGAPIITACAGRTGIAHRWTLLGVEPPTKVTPNSNCTTTVSGPTACKDCNNGKLCWQYSHAAPSVAISAGVTNYTDDGVTTWIYPPSFGDLCNLTVVGWGVDFIEVNATVVPCVTSGGMFSGTITTLSTRRWTVLANGWVVQSIWRGALAWKFDYTPSSPHETPGQINSTVVHNNPSVCVDDKDCKCQDWDCGGLTCYLFKNSWTSCKCSLITGYSGPKKLSCQFLTALFDIFMYGTFALVGCILLLYLWRRLKQPRTSTSKDNIR